MKNRGPLILTNSLKGILRGKCNTPLFKCLCLFRDYFNTVLLYFDLLYTRIFFMISDDPTESNNLASRFPNKVKKMMIRLDELRKDSLPTELPVLEANEIGSPNNIVSTEWCSV